MAKSKNSIYNTIIVAPTRNGKGLSSKIPTVIYAPSRLGMCCLPFPFCVWRMIEKGLFSFSELGKYCYG
jgi:hypothetical protein